MSENQNVIRIACAQIECVIDHPRANLVRHLDWIARAKEKNCDVVVFPELSLTGYGAWSSVPDVSLLGHSKELHQLAESCEGIKAVVSFIEEGDGGLFYNSTAWLTDGQIAFIHRKLNLPTYGRLAEGKSFAKGKSVDLFKMDQRWTAATLICADVWNPALVHLAVQQKATVLITPIASTEEAVGGGFDNSSGWDLTTRFYSMMYGLPMGVCNWVGSTGDQTYWGGSRILDASGQILAEAGRDEELIVADLDYKCVLEARFRLPTLRDADPEVIHRHFRRIFEEE